MVKEYYISNIKLLFLLVGQKIDLFVPQSKIKCNLLIFIELHFMHIHFLPSSRKKIVCNTGKTFIFSSCTIYCVTFSPKKIVCNVQSLKSKFFEFFG